MWRSICPNAACPKTSPTTVQLACRRSSCLASTAVLSILRTSTCREVELSWSEVDRLGARKDHCGVSNVAHMGFAKKEHCGCHAA